MPAVAGAMHVVARKKESWSRRLPAQFIVEKKRRTKSWRLPAQFVAGRKVANTVIASAGALCGISTSERAVV